jgi:hypothetical protein
MSVHESRGNLAKAVKELTLRWAEARQNWDDAQAVDFEDKFIRELEANIRSAGSAMDQMAVVLTQARRDCE